LKLFLSFGVQLDCSADYLLEGRFIDLDALMQIDGAPCVAIQAGIEDTLRVFDRSALRESQLYMSLIGFAGADDPAVTPDWNSPPLPFFGNLRVCLCDQLADVGKRLAAPVAELCDSLGDQLRRRFALISVGFLLLLDHKHWPRIWKAELVRKSIQIGMTFALGWAEPREGGRVNPRVTPAG
jgi:hypothetical protein